MAINYHIQELPDMHNGKQKLFPKAETYTAFNNRKMVKRIALESGLQEGAVLAVLDALPKALKNILLEGHTCKIDGLGTFSLSLSFNEEGRVTEWYHGIPHKIHTNKENPQARNDFTNASGTFRFKK